MGLGGKGKQVGPGRTGVKKNWVLGSVFIQRLEQVGVLRCDLGWRGPLRVPDSRWH